MKKLALIIFILMGLALPVLAEEFHVVRAGESLSEVAGTYLGRPIYTPGTGSLDRLLCLNPEISKRDLIFPGQRIRISEKSAELRQPAQAGEVSPAQVSTGEVPPADVSPVSPAEPQPSENLPTTAASPAPKNDLVLHILSVGFDSGMVSLGVNDETTGADSELYSKYKLGLQLGLAQKWSGSFTTFQQFSLRKIEIEPSTNPLKTLTGTNKTLSGIKIGGSLDLSDRLRINLAVGQNSELFVRGVNSSSVAVDSVPLLTVEASAKFKVVQKGNTSFGLDAGAAHTGSASTENYKIKSGIQYQAGAFIEREGTGGNDLTIDAGIRERHQDTSFVGVKDREIYLGVRYSVPLFGGGK